MDKEDIKRFLTVLQDLAYIQHKQYHQSEKPSEFAAGSTEKSTCKLCFKYDNMEESK